MTDPTIEAARSLLDESLEAMREAVRGADPEALDWRPAGEETNSLAVLSVHALSSARWWLSMAVGAPMPERHRPSEFLATAADPAELLSFIDDMASDCRSLLGTDGPWEASVVRTTPDGSETVSAAWALLHANEHLREHVGHAQLTRQIWDRARPGVRPGA